jgi:transcriptional regulator with PAS, ATPase and Fis domain
LFLDEINSLPLLLQPKVLRAIEYGEIYPVGDTQAIHVNTRIVAATNVSLLELSQQGLFRKDLFYRLNEIEIVIPELTQKDIVKYSRYFLHHFAKSFNKQFAEHAPDFDEKVLQKRWDGGIREIKNVMKRSVLLSKERFELALKDGSGSSEADAEMDPRPPAEKAQAERRILPLETLEKEAMQQALEITQWNIPHCSHCLQIGESTLRRKIKKYGLKPAP